jgi:putative MATE family efflux protein
MLIGKISGSALAVTGISNTAFTFVISAFAMLTNGSAILTARMIGANKNDEASEIIEQSMSFAAVGSIAMTIIFELCASVIIRILIPNADEMLLREATSFFRIIALSFPILLVFTVLSNVMRSAGNSIIPMATNILMNLVQLLSSYLLINVCNLKMAGVGVSYIIGRFFGMAVILFAVLHSDYNFHISLKKLFKLKYAIFKKIFKIGFPISIESSLVQGGYLAANVMAVGLGIRNATTFQVSNTINTFFSLPQGVCSTVSMVTAGQLIGAKEYKKAKKNVWNILYISLAATMIISLPLTLCGKYVASFYSEDISVIAESAKMLWVLLVITVPAVFINTFDPALRTGGDPKFVMSNAIFGVWLFRIPLTYILCYRMNMGVFGILLANLISLMIRGTSSVVRYQKGNWLHKDI